MKPVNQKNDEHEKEQIQQRADFQFHEQGEAGVPIKKLCRMVDDSYLDRALTHQNCCSCRRDVSQRRGSRRLVVVSGPSLSLQFNGRRLWACGRKLRRWATQAAHRCVAHGRSRRLAGASSTCPSPAGRKVFPRPFHTLAGMTVGLCSRPRIISFARSARQALTRRCSARSCALPASAF